MTYDDWTTHFETAPERQRALEAEVPWDSPCTLPARDRAAFVRSFQRFALGEDGDGARLLAKARAAGDPGYVRALELLVAEEQRHAALFRRGLVHLGGEELEAHWSDAAFTLLRRSLGLRTEIALFLVAEAVAMGWFTALADDAPDPVLRGIGRRVATDERDHLRFQVDRLREGSAGVPRPLRAAVGLVWTGLAAGAATVLVLDHGGALVACGLRRGRYWLDAVATFRRAASAALAGGAPLGPTTPTRATTAAGAVAG